MLRPAFALALLVSCCATPALAQPDSLESYFTGKQAVAKIDMPGSEKGIDLKCDKSTPMDWNDYLSRLKTFGVAIHKGDAVRITKFNVKKDMIEFQLNGGGYGTFGEDTNATVTATVVPKSQLEKDLEKQVADTKDPKRRDELQRDLDKERARRQREDAANQSNAQVASQLKAQQIMQKRLDGGSRINLRWKDSIPSDNRNPQAVMQLLAEYVDFNPSAQTQVAPAVQAPPPPTPSTGWDPTTQLKRGMKLGDVNSLFGMGNVASNTVSSDGLKTQVIRYGTQENLIDVTFVEGIVVRYSISSR